MNAFVNMFKIPELRKRLLYTLGMLAVYRVGIEAESLCECERLAGFLIGASDPVGTKVRTTCGDPPLCTLPEPPEFGLQDRLNVRSATS